MNFTDPTFFVFFLVVFSLYYLCRTSKQQISVLALASLIFYAWESPMLLGVFACSWLITGLTTYKVAMVEDQRLAKLFAIVGVVANLSLLGFFKYKFLWIQDAVVFGAKDHRSFAEWLLLAPLPIGISFYTFHGISLLVDVYRRGASLPTSGVAGGVLGHLFNSLLYLVFFPQLIAGPIIKAKDFFPQIGYKKIREVDVHGSFKILVTGFFLKCVVANNLAEQTAWMAYPHFLRKSSTDLVFMLYGYSAQIFADFAGYSLIAIGLAKLLGYRLPDNFNFPYLSSSIAEFWRRWHISLSSWLRDYLYVPLGGNRKGVFRTYLNLVVVMVLGGLWHGAAWSFAIWGLWHGVGLALERPWLQTRWMQSGYPAVKGIRIFLVFNFVSLGWLLFKHQEFAHAITYLRLMVSNPNASGGMLALFLISTYAFFVFAYHGVQRYKDNTPAWGKDLIYGFLLFMVLVNSGPSSTFIYFQF